MQCDLLKTKKAKKKNKKAGFKKKSQKNPKKATGLAFFLKKAGFFQPCS